VLVSDGLTLVYRILMGELDVKITDVRLLAHLLLVVDSAGQLHLVSALAHIRTSSGRTVSSFSSSLRFSTI